MTDGGRFSEGRREETNERGERRLLSDYEASFAEISARLAVEENFDVISRRLAVGGGEIALFYVNGFSKDGEMQKILSAILSWESLPDALDFERKLPYIEAHRTRDEDKLLRAVLSGETAILGSTFGDEAILLDARSYPARGVSEPESDKVMQGARDGFVETLVVNTALIRRRVRDERLVMRHVTVGGASGTDVVVCYMKGVADPEYVEKIYDKLTRVRPKSLTLGFQSLAETLIRTHWYNPFPKIRTTERPDTAAAQVLEGNVLVLCDTSPQVMILPTAIFDYLQQTDDYYFPPLTGSYLRLVRTFILVLSVVAIPLWYLYLGNADALPDGFRFLIPKDPGTLPILLQLYLAEIAIDGLKIASMNTPDMLSNSLSVVGALILGDFAIGVGWFCQDVILYMAFVAIANFAQQNHELGYAFKFVRMLTLAFVALAGIWGFFAGILVGLTLVATNRTVEGSRSYLYPLIPFDGRALSRLLFRRKKSDFAR